MTSKKSVKTNKLPKLPKVKRKILTIEIDTPASDKKVRKVLMDLKRGLKDDLEFGITSMTPSEAENTRIVQVQVNTVS